MISIVMSCYNSEKFIREAIESVIAQTYANWELLIIDDCSTDSSVSIINEYVKKFSAAAETGDEGKENSTQEIDNKSEDGYKNNASPKQKIKLFHTKKNSKRPAIPRNIGIENAQGRYIAFLDSDDIYLPNKLEEQVKLFDENTAIVFSYYEKISEGGERNCRIVKSPSALTYSELLCGNSIGFLTAIYDTKKVGKIYFKNIPFEDYLYWLEILRDSQEISKSNLGGEKKIFIAKNANKVLALYRIHNQSFSASKIKSAKYTWNIYRRELSLSFTKSIFYFLTYMLKGIVKHWV